MEELVKLNLFSPNMTKLLWKALEDVKAGKIATRQGSVYDDDFRSVLNYDEGEYDSGIFNFEECAEYFLECCYAFNNVKVELLYAMAILCMIEGSLKMSFDYLMEAFRREQFNRGKYHDRYIDLVDKCYGIINNPTIEYLESRDFEFIRHCEERVPTIIKEAKYVIDKYEELSKTGEFPYVINELLLKNKS